MSRSLRQRTWWPRTPADPCRICGLQRDQEAPCWTTPLPMARSSTPSPPPVRRSRAEPRSSCMSATQVARCDLSPTCPQDHWGGPHHVKGLTLSIRTVEQPSDQPAGTVLSQFLRPVQTCASSVITLVVFTGGLEAVVDRQSLPKPVVSRRYPSPAGHLVAECRRQPPDHPATRLARCGMRTSAV